MTENIRNREWLKTPHALRMRYQNELNSHELDVLGGIRRMITDEERYGAVRASTKKFHAQAVERRDNTKAILDTFEREQLALLDDE